VIVDFFWQQNWILQECSFYDTTSVAPNPSLNLQQFDEIVFTSPSTVDAFIQFFKQLPHDKQLTCIGPITAAYLKSKINI